MAALAAATARIPSYQIVISAHGIRLPEHPDPRRRTKIEIPKNFSLHILPNSYSLVCQPRYQTFVCATDRDTLQEIRDKFQHFNGPIGDAPRNPDRHTITFDMKFNGNPVGKGGFLTGIVLCKDPKNAGENTAILSIKEGKELTLSYAVRYIYDHMRRIHPDENYRVHITVLTCTGMSGMSRTMYLGNLAAAPYGGAGAGAGSGDAHVYPRAGAEEIFGPSYEGGARKSRKNNKRKSKKSRKMRQSRLH